MTQISLLWCYEGQIIFLTYYYWVLSSGFVLQQWDGARSLPLLCLPHQRPGPGAGGRPHVRGGSLPRHGGALPVCGVHLPSLRDLILCWYRLWPGSKRLDKAGQEEEQVPGGSRPLQHRQPVRWLAGVDQEPRQHQVPGALRVSLRECGRLPPHISLRVRRLAMVWPRYIRYISLFPASERRPRLVQSYREYFRSLPARNIAKLMSSFNSRSSLKLARDIAANGKTILGANRTLKMPVLNMVGEFSPHVDQTVNFNGRLDPEKCTWMKINDASLVVVEQVDKVAQSIVLFLQGLGYTLRKPLRWWHYYLLSFYAIFAFFYPSYNYNVLRHLCLFVNIKRVL